MVPGMAKAKPLTYMANPNNPAHIFCITTGQTTFPNTPIVDSHCETIFNIDSSLKTVII